jgi:hypothetical protein
MLGKEETIKYIMNSHNLWKQHFENEKSLISKENVTLSHNRITKKEAKSILKKQN